MSAPHPHRAGKGRCVKGECLSSGRTAVGCCRGHAELHGRALAGSVQRREGGRSRCDCHGVHGRWGAGQSVHGSDCRQPAINALHLASHHLPPPSPSLTTCLWAHQCPPEQVPSVQPIQAPPCCWPDQTTAHCQHGKVYHKTVPHSLSTHTHTDCQPLTWPPWPCLTPAAVTMMSPAPDGPSPVHLLPPPCHTSLPSLLRHFCFPAPLTLCLMACPHVAPTTIPAFPPLHL